MSTQQETAHSSTSTIEETRDIGTQVTTVRVTLRPPKKLKKVAWTSDTRDNENMNKKKSKSCCIYKKPRAFDESSSSSDSEDEDEHHSAHQTNPTPEGTSNPPTAESISNTETELVTTDLSGQVES